MKRFLSILFVLCGLTINAQITQVSGNQYGTWSGEVHITDNVIVPNGETLTIEPGTSVISDGYFEIIVRGNLYAIGEENARIVFTVADTTGYSNYNNVEAGAWRGLFFSKAGSVRLSYCDFSYGKTPIEEDGGAMRVDFCYDFEIDHCSFHHNTMRRKGGAIYAENSNMNIHYCEVYDNFGVGIEGSYCWGTGFQFLKCDLIMHDLVFHDNYCGVGYGGGMNVDSCNLELNNAIFYNNFAVDAGGLGIQRCKDYSVKVSNMLAYNNSVIHYGGGLAMATSDPELNNLTIVNNYCGGGGGAGMQTAFNACPTLNNCIFWGNHAVYTTNEKTERDTVEYYMGSQIWLWGSDCYPVFNNGVLQYGMDSIGGHENMSDEQYNNMIESDPLFVDENARNYQLLANSPCINAGTESIAGLFLPDTDLIGGPRVYNNRIDMGCYEWNDLNVHETSTDGKSLVVYPNPLNDNALCVVSLNKRSDVVLRLLTLDGKEVYREEIGTYEAGQHAISLTKMMNSIGKSNGIYLLNIDNQYIKIIY